MRLWIGLRQLYSIYASVHSLYCTLYTFYSQALWSGKRAIARPRDQLTIALPVTYPPSAHTEHKHASLPLPLSGTTSHSNQQIHFHFASISIRLTKQNSATVSTEPLLALCTFQICKICMIHSFTCTNTFQWITL